MNLPFPEIKLRRYERVNNFIIVYNMHVYHGNTI